MPETGTVAALRRYPVKSMLGENLNAVALTASGLEGDRAVAVIDQQTGDVASAKHPRLWRGLLAFAAQWNDGSPRITLPDGASVSAAGDAGAQLLTQMLHRDVRLATVRPERATVARPDPEDVIENGEDADVPYEMLEIGTGTPGKTFVDFAPVHLISSATLARVGAEMIRYRPNRDHAADAAVRGSHAGPRSPAAPRRRGPDADRGKPRPDPRTRCPALPWHIRRGPERRHGGHRGPGDAAMSDAG